MIRGLIKIFVSIIIIGIIIGIIGVVIGGFSFAEIRKGFNADEDYTLVNKTEEGLLNNIVIDCEDNLVNIIVSDDSNYNVSYYEAEYYPITYTVSESTMTITGKRINRLKWFNFRYASSAVRLVTITIPSEFSGSINVITANGAITVDNIGNVINLDLRTSNGKITAKNMSVSNDVNLRTSNGSIIADDMTIQGDLVASTSNGKIEMNRVTADKIRVNNSNGNNNLYNITCDDIDTTTSNGSIDISIKGVYSEYKIDVATSNGNIKVNGLSVNNQIINATAVNKVKAKTSNGSIDISFVD